MSFVVKEDHTREVYQDVVITIIKQMGSRPVTKEIIETFMAVDTNEDGRITLDEMVRGFVGLGVVNLSNENARILFSKMDQSHNGTVDIKEFSNFLQGEFENTTVSMDVTTTEKTMDTVTVEQLVEEGTGQEAAHESPSLAEGPKQFQKKVSFMISDSDPNLLTKKSSGSELPLRPALVNSGSFGTSPVVATAEPLPPKRQDRDTKHNNMGALVAATGAASVAHSHRENVAALAAKPIVPVDAKNAVSAKPVAQSQVSMQKIYPEGQAPKSGKRKGSCCKRVCCKFRKPKMFFWLVILLIVFIVLIFLATRDTDDPRDFSTSTPTAAPTATPTFIPTATPTSAPHDIIPGN